jgi:hypothetical protein
VDVLAPEESQWLLLFSLSCFPSLLFLAIPSSFSITHASSLQLGDLVIFGCAENFLLTSSFHFYPLRAHKLPCMLGVVPCSLSWGQILCQVSGSCRLVTNRGTPTQKGQFVSQGNEEVAFFFCILIPGTPPKCCLP